MRSCRTIKTIFSVMFVSAVLIGSAAAPSYCDPLSVPVSAAVKVSAPEGVKAEQDADSVKLCWDKANNVYEYKVYMKKGSDKRFDLYSTTKDNSTVINGLKTGVTYEFKVSSVKKTGSKQTESAASGIVKIKIEDVKLPAPEGLRTTGSGEDYVKLSWEPVKGAGYYIVKCNYGGEEAFMKAETNELTFTGLNPASPYYFSVASSSRKTIGLDFSDQIKAVTLPKMPTLFSYAPADVRASSVTKNSITLTWSKDDRIKDGSYCIMIRSENRLKKPGYPGDDRLVNIYTTKENSITIDGLDPFTSYYYSVLEVSDDLNYMDFRYFNRVITKAE